MSEGALVITHAGCADGFCAAWVLARALGPDTEIYPSLYNSPPPDPVILAGRRVYLTDFSYPREEIRAVAELAESLTVFDHHPTAQDDLAGLEEELTEEGLNVRIVFDMERSGSGITWDEMHPGEGRPWVVEYVEDRDLWRFRFRMSREVNAYIATVPQELAAWDRLMETSWDVAVTKGVGIVAYLEEYSRRVLEDAYRITFHGHPAVLVNAHYHSISEVLEHALEQVPDAEIAMSWYKRGDGLYQYSLRTRKGGPIVSELARRYDGGGHPRAAGFRSTMELEFDGREEAANPD